MKKLILLLILCLPMIKACKSAKEKFNDKDYAGAFEEAYSDLKKGKKKSENSALVRNSLSRMQGIFETNSSKYNAANLDGKGNIVDEGLALVERYERALNFVDIPNGDIVNLKNRTDSLKLNTGKLYLEHGKQGIQTLINTKNKNYALQTLNDLNRVERYLGLSNEVKTLKDEVYKYGTKYIVFDLRQNGYGGNYDSYSANNIFSQLEGESRNRLVRRYFNRRVSASDLDCEVRINLNYSQPRTSTRTRSENFSQNIEDGYDTKIDANGKEVKTVRYKKVTATVNIEENVIEYRGDADCDVFGSTNNCTLRDNRFSDSVNDSAERYSIQGDQRAVPSRYKNGSQQRRKTDRQLQEELMQKLYERVRSEYAND